MTGEARPSHGARIRDEWIPTPSSAHLEIHRNHAVLGWMECGLTTYANAQNENRTAGDVVNPRFVECFRRRFPAKPLPRNQQEGSITRKLSGAVKSISGATVLHQLTRDPVEVLLRTSIVRWESVHDQSGSFIPFRLGSNALATDFTPTNLPSGHRGSTSKCTRRP